MASVYINAPLSLEIIPTSPGEFGRGASVEEGLGEGGQRTLGSLLFGQQLSALYDGAVDVGCDGNKGGRGMEGLMPLVVVTAILLQAGMSGAYCLVGVLILTSLAVP